MELFDFPQADKVSSDGLITFLDVETPNRHNDRICSIGIVQTDMRGDVVNSLSRLVNPEEPFDDICMSIHGIAPIDVKGAPSFAELWDLPLRDARPVEHRRPQRVIRPVGNLEMPFRVRPAGARAPIRVHYVHDEVDAPRARKP